MESSALKSRFSYFWTRAKWGENEKREGGGEERGRKETLARKPHDFAERPLDTFTLERTLVECLSNTPCGFFVKVRWKQSGSFCEYRSTDDVKQKKQKTENKTTPNKT